VVGVDLRDFVEGGGGDGVGRYLVVMGRQLRLEVRKTADLSQIRLRFLLSTSVSG